jgi:predicted ATPase
MARRISCPVLVGRDAPLATLLADLEEAVRGSGGVILLEGEAGIGKTRLVQEFCGVARKLGVRVLEGHCWPFLETVPYAPLLDILDVFGQPAGSWASAADSERPSVTRAMERTRFFQQIADG